MKKACVEDMAYIATQALQHDTSESENSDSEVGKRPRSVRAAIKKARVDLTNYFNTEIESGDEINESDSDNEL